MISTAQIRTTCSAPTFSARLSSRLSSRRSFASSPKLLFKSNKVFRRTSADGILRMVSPIAAASNMSTVKVVVQGLHMPMTPALKEYAESKVNKAVHNFEGAVKEIDVKLSASGSHGKAAQVHHQRNQKVEVTVYTLRHGVIRVEDVEDDLYAAIDLVTDKLKRKMTRVKEKAVQRGTWPGRGGSKGGDVISDHLNPEESDEELPSSNGALPVLPDEIVREKLLFLESRMSPEEAMDQLEAVGHDFFVFVDSNDGSLKVIYRRRHHGYGLLIPQVPEPSS